MVGCHPGSDDRLLPDEDILDVDEKQDRIGEMGDGARVVDRARELLPLELDELFDQVGLKDP